MMTDIAGLPITIGDSVIFARPQGGNCKNGRLDIGIILKYNEDTGYVTIQTVERKVATPFRSNKFYRLGTYV
jgi:hypothetical protein